MAPSWRTLRSPSIACICAVAVVLSWSAAASDAQEAGEPVRIGVLAKRSPERCLEKWSPTADYLTSRIPGHSFEVTPLTFDEVYPAVERGQVDFILVNPAYYVGAERLYGASRIATLRNLGPGGMTTFYGGVIFCRADRTDIQSLQDLKGKTFMAPYEQALGAWYAVWLELKGNGINPSRDFGALRFGGSQDAVVNAVRDGEVDVGSVKTDTLERMALEGKIRLEDFRVIHQQDDPRSPGFAHSTRLYPEWPFATLATTSDELAVKVAIALMSMSPESAAARAARCAGWTIPHDYQPVHECLKALRVGPYEGYGRVSLQEAIRQHQRWVLGAAALVILILLFAAYVQLLNRRLAQALAGEHQELAERRQVEEALRESEARYRTVFENTGTATCIVEDDMTISLANKQFAELSGYSREELEGKRSWTEFVTDEYLEMMTSHHRNRRQDGGVAPTEYEFDFRDREGNVKRILLRVDVIPGTRQSLASLLDITDRKRAEEALREGEARFRELAHLVPIIIFETDEHGRLTFANRAAFETFGYTPADFAAGLSALEMIAPDDRVRARANVAKVLAGEELLGIEYTCIRKDGAQFPVATYASPVAHDGSFVGMRGVLLDLTEQKHLEDQLRQAQKMEAVGELAGGVAHDFNNMLTVIKGNADMLSRALDDDAGAQGYLADINKAVDQAGGLTHQLLAFSRRQMLEPQVLDLNQVVTEVTPMLQRLIEENIQLVAVLQPELGRVEADPAQIEQVIVNLVVNARDAMPEGGQITIETANVDLGERYVRQHPEAQVGAHVMLAVSDTGVGMDEETQSRIFEPFFTTKPKERGTGLGLSTVYGIVKQSGGNIHVYSEVGVGSTFKVYLPRVEKEAMPRREIAGPGETLEGSETILIVEDEEMVRSLIVTTMTEYGYHVLAVADGAEALRICEQHEGPIHLMVTDVIMPGMGGRELAEQAARMRPDMRLLYMSGYTDNAIVNHGILEPGIHLLRKPFEPEELARRARELLDMPEENRGDDRDDS